MPQTIEFSVNCLDTPPAAHRQPAQAVLIRMRRGHHAVIVCEIVILLDLFASAANGFDVAVRFAWEFPL
jgi:hypothetical protein